MTEYKKKIILELADSIKKQGFRVFIAARGTYGFFTDKDGLKLISFESEFLPVYFSGNYKTDNPKQTGTGWRITDADEGDYKALFESCPPPLAVGNTRWSYTTLDQHLDAYNNTSKYKEI